MPTWTVLLYDLFTLRPATANDIYDYNFRLLAITRSAGVDFICNRSIDRGTSDSIGIRVSIYQSQKRNLRRNSSATHRTDSCTSTKSQSKFRGSADCLDQLDGTTCVVLLLTFPGFINVM